jgi:hypothetical protein
MGFSSTVLDAN